MSPLTPASLPQLPEAFLPALLDLLPSGVVYYTPVRDAPGEVVDFHFAYLNPAAQRMLRLAAQPPGTYLQQWPASATSGAFAFHRDTFLGDHPAQRKEFYQADGYDGYFHVHARSLADGLLVTFTDANDQPRSAVEEALRASQAALAAERATLLRLFEQAPALVNVQRGPTHVFELVHPLTYQLLGQRPLLGLASREALPELEGPFHELLDQVYQTGQPFYGREVLARLDRHHSGELADVYFDFTYQPLLTPEGLVEGVLTFAVDVTSQVLARQQVEQFNQELETRVAERTSQLSAQQTLLRQILGQVPAAIATLSGPEHHYSFFNDHYQHLAAGRTVLGCTVAEVFPEVVAQGFIGLLDQVYASGQPFIGTDMPVQLHDAATGQLRQYHVDFIYQPLLDAQQRVQGILAFILDVTDRTQARQQAAHSQQQVDSLNQELAAANTALTTTNLELHASNTHLTRTNRDLDTFVYTASHDLKAPITNIEGVLNALTETLPAAVQQNEEVAQLLTLLTSNVRRFQATIHQLTDLARLQRAYEEAAERQPLARVVADVVTDLEPAIAAAQAQVHLAIATELPVSFAPASLRSIVYNLLSNALKYRDPARPAQVWLRAEQQPGTVVFTVQDNGLGLNERQQQRLFGLFERLHTHVEGTGVGLYMIKRLIDNAGATITVTSLPGVGSTFTVTFPA